MHGEVALFDEVAVPDIAEDVVFGDDLAAVLDKELEDVEGFGCEVDVPVVFDDRSFDGV